MKYQPFFVLVIIKCVHPIWLDVVDGSLCVCLYFGICGILYNRIHNDESHYDKVDACGTQHICVAGAKSCSLMHNHLNQTLPDPSCMHDYTS